MMMMMTTDSDSDYVYIEPYKIHYFISALIYGPIDSIILMG
jgi:hypothetical protein